MWLGMGLASLNLKIFEFENGSIGRRAEQTGATQA